MFVPIWVLDLWEDPMDAAKGRVLVTGAFDRITMRWRDERPDFVAQPVSLSRPIPAHSMVRTAIGGARIGRNQ
jgi:hypothetical protein